MNDHIKSIVQAAEKLDHELDYGGHFAVAEARVALRHAIGVAGIAAASAPHAAPVVSEEASRSQFESWWAENFDSSINTKRSDGGYALNVTNIGWMAWQAALSVPATDDKAPAVDADTLPPLPNASYAGIFTPEQMYAYAREANAALWKAIDEAARKSCESGGFDNIDQVIPWMLDRAAELGAAPTSPHDVDAWIATNGAEPDGWDHHDYLWLRWDNGRIEFAEGFGTIAWHETTHWMPATLVTPAQPALTAALRKPGEA